MISTEREVNPNPVVHEILSAEGKVNYVDLFNYDHELLKPKYAVKRLGDTIYVYSRKIPGMRLAAWKLHSDGAFHLINEDLTGHDLAP